MSTAKKKRGESPSSPATQAARSHSRQDTQEKHLNRANAASPESTGEGREGRPPTGRRRRRTPAPVVQSVSDSPASLDPYVAAVHQITDAETGGGTGAVMNVETSSEFDFSFEEEDAKNATGATTTMPSAAEGHWWNPHYLHAVVVSVVAMFFIAVFGYYVADVNGPLEQSEKHMDRVALEVRNVVDALLEEMTYANAVLSTSEFAISRSLEQSASFLEDITQSIAAYQSSITATDAQIGAAFLVHEEYLSSIVGGTGGLLLDRALDIAALARLRNAIIKGGAPSVVVPMYDNIIGNLVGYQSRLFAAMAFVDHGDRLALDVAYAALEGQVAVVGAMFVQYLNATSSSSAGALRGFANQSEMFLSWQLEPMIGVAESFMRYAASDEGYLSEATTNATAATYRTRSLNAMQLPSAAATAMRGVGAESYAGAAFSWNATYGGELLATISSSLTASQRLTVSFDDAVLDIHNTHDVAIVTVLILLFVVSALALIGHVASAVHYAQNKAAHDVKEREVRTLQKSLTRMSTFVGKVLKLDVTAAAAIIRKAQRTRSSAIPTEEMQLYTSLTSLRDMECFLPLTVTRPPADVPTAALSKAGNLFLKPALTHVRGAVAVRVALSTFHAQFQSAGSKQKAVQHQLTRCLTALQEIGDEHLPQSSSVLSVQGDHAILWINLIHRVPHPTMRAISIAHALVQECNRLGMRQPYICVAVGDALVGHVSSQPPVTSGGSGCAHVTAFTSFGTVARDLNILDNVCRVHDVGIAYNNAAVMSYFQDRMEYDTDGFNLASSNQVGFAAEDAHDTAEAAVTDGSGAGDKGRGGGALQARERIPLDERLRALHCFFRPLEMVNTATSRAGEDTFALLETHLTLTKERAAQLKARRGSNPVAVNPLGLDVLTLDDGSWFKDYSRDVADGSVMFPSYTSIPFSSNRKDEESALLAWNACFALYVGCCEECTADKLSIAMQSVTEFAAKFPHHGGPPVERMKRSLLLARNTGTIGVSAAGLKRSRLLDTLCV